MFETLSNPISYVHLGNGVFAFGGVSTDGVAGYMLWFCYHGPWLVDTFIDLTAVDLSETEKVSGRFGLSYFLISLSHGHRLLLNGSAAEYVVPVSTAGVFPGAIWAEREVWDMFGVFFIGHPDMRRLLSDYGAFFFPLRKDFPCAGFIRARYTEELKKVHYRRLTAVQTGISMQRVTA